MIPRAVKPKTLTPVRANAALEARYYRRLEAMIVAMQADIVQTVGASWVDHENALAMDASPAIDLAAAIRRLRARWERAFNELAPDLARYFATAAKDRTDAQLKAALRKAGFTVKFQWTPAVRNITQASIAENVTLIKSIPAAHFTQIEGDVMRAVQVGGDLGTLTAKLEHQFGVTHRRAALISRDQTRKAMAVVEKERQQEIGITQAIWRHSAGGKHPRPSHVKAGKDGVIYDTARGWYDPDVGEFVWPGTLINCRCYSKPIIPALAAIQKAA